MSFFGKSTLLYELTEQEGYHAPTLFLQLFHRKEADTKVESAKPSYFRLPKEEEAAPVVSNAFPVKAMAPDKRVKLEKSDSAGSLETAMPPPPPREVPVEGQTSLVKTIQSEVEEKLEKQKQDNRDIMDTDPNASLSTEQQQQNEHFDETASDIRMFSKTWEDYCTDTMESLLDIDVELSVIENQLLFTLDNSAEAKLESFQKTLDVNALVTRLKAGDTPEKTTE